MTGSTILFTDDTTVIKTTDNNRTFNLKLRETTSEVTEHWFDSNMLCIYNKKTHVIKIPLSEMSP